MNLASVVEITAVLAERDAPTIADRIAGLDGARFAAAHDRFMSFGTCSSIIDPLTELVELGPIPAAVLSSFLADGDEVAISAIALGADGERIGFGEVTGQILPRQPAGN